jgi:putative DNA primase/helicase
MSTSTSASVDSAAVTLNDRDRQMFGRLGISPELLDAAKVERVSDRDARERFGILGPATQDMSGIIFPYFSHVTGRRVTARVRRDNPEMENGRPKRKYVSAYGDGRHLYFPPEAWSSLQTQNTPIVLVESEKATLALSAWARRTGTDLLAVGMGGCWGWRGRIGKTEAIDGSRVDKTGPLPDLDVCNGRTVYLLLDSNVAKNWDVQQARNALARELLKRECTVGLCNLPDTPGVNGPDDYIAARGDEAMKVLFEEAEEADDAPAEFSDDALALRFTEKHGDELRYTSQWGRWNRWNGHQWKEDDTIAVYDLSRRICREVAVTSGKKNVAARITSANTFAAVERIVRSDRRHAAIPSQWDADPWLLNTPGGIVDLRTGEIHPSDSLKYCTKSTSVAPGGDCQLWRQFLRQVTNGDDDLVSYLQRVVGYILTGSTREHALFFLFGSGANGKSVTINTVTGILADYARVAAIETFTATQGESHPTDLAGLQGSRCVTAAETEDGRRWAESKVKAMTGGDPIAARFMRCDFFQFTPQFKLLISGNHKPGLKTVDEAVRRRFHLIPFAVTIPEELRDKELPEKLRREWPGILQWMIEGCLEWQRIGLAAPEAVTKATADYMAAEDSLGIWIADRCENDRGSWTSAKSLFESWKTWAEGAGDFVGSAKRLAQNLEARGYLRGRANQTRGFQGIRLKGEA